MDSMRKLLNEVAASSIEWDAGKYVTVQIDKETWEEITDRSRLETCSICSQPISEQPLAGGGVWTDGHNAQPVNDGRCCDLCNDTVVIPRRMFGKESEEKSS